MSRNLLYVVGFGYDKYSNGEVAIYDAKLKDPKPIAIITDGLSEPNGACIDHTGDFFVASQNGFVTEYSPGSTTPLRYIDDGLSTPVDCAIDTSGDLWVADVDNGAVEYREGSSSPEQTITNGLREPNSVVFDHVGNMYVGNEQGNIEVFPPGYTSPTRAIGEQWPIGTAVDANDTLYVVNYAVANSGCGDVNEYRHGRAEPFRTIKHEMEGPTAVTLDRTGRLYVANEGISGCKDGASYDVVLEFLPGGVKPSSRMIKTLLYPTGLAYYPPQLP